MSAAPQPRHDGTQDDGQQTSYQYPFPPPLPTELFIAILVSSKVWMR
jgi:hypothetical protein